MKHIYHSTSKIHGLGVNAGESIKKGEVIQRIKGEPRSFVPRTKEESAAYPNWVGVGKNKWIDPDYPNQYLNHSCNPNSGIKGKVTMVALKDIKEGEEITIDYSIIEGDEMWEMECNCGAKDCRKTVRSIQFLPEKQFKKYMPYIPKYFQKLHNLYRHDKPLHG
jgi:uncharacterized protein